jgi:MoaA/NifB/PqqE/SkfB family radical SAM enzyme
MDTVDIAVGFVVGVIASLAAALIYAICTEPGRKLIEIWDDFKKLRKMGLKLFLPFDEFKKRDIFEKMIANGKGSTEILIVGRTNRWLIQRKREDLIKGLKNGLNFKILMLNPQKVKNDKIELRPLQLQLENLQGIKNDLDISKKEMLSICNEASLQKYTGSFECRICDFVIFNSFTSFTQEKERKSILDFSFGYVEKDKYQQYYEFKPQDENHFGNKLHNFYKEFYVHSDTYIHYSEGKVKRSRYIFEENINALIEEYSGCEKIRRNDVKNFLYAIPSFFDSIRKIQTPSTYPISIQLELTNKCNDARCEHCKRYTWPNNNEMSTNRIKNLLSELARLKVQSVTFSGGEPTLKEDFEDILKYAYNKGLKVGVLTNGLDIKPGLADALTKYSSWVRISLDGSNGETYQRIRGCDGFARVKESIKNLEGYNKKNDRKCIIGICYSIQKQNIDDVIKMVGFVKNLSLSDKEKCLTFKFVHGRNGFTCSNPQLSEFHENVFKNENLTKDKISNLQYLKKFMEDYSSKEDIAKGSPLNSYYQKYKIRCFTPYLFSLIDAFGNVYPCCFLYHDNDSYKGYENEREKYKIGTISDKDSFKSIWLSKEYQRIRNDLETINIPRFSECGGCTRHYFHNTFLTKLFDEYNSCIDDMGDEKGKTLFQQILDQYSSKEVWL